MKKIFLLTFLLCMLLITNNQVKAEEGIDQLKAKVGIDVTLTEPNVSALAIGSEVNYKVNVSFTKPLSTFSNLFITLRLDNGLEYKSSQIEGATGKAGSFEAYSKPNDDGRSGFITIRLTDMTALAGKTSFSVNTLVKVLDSAKVGEKVTNQITLSSQSLGQLNDANYYQFEQISNVSVAKKGTDVKPLDDKPIDLKNQILKVKTGAVYGDFMTDFEGVTNSVNKIQAKFGDKTETISPNADGTFKIKIPTDYKGDIVVSSLSSSNAVIKTLTMKYVDEYSMNDTHLNTAVTALKEYGYVDLVERYLREFKVYTDQMAFIIGIEGGTYQDMYKLFRELYFATRTSDNQVKTHNPFMNGYPEGNFLPGNSIKRSETAAILSRLIQGGEVSNMIANFPDVPKNEWYTKYIAHLTNLGIMKGYKEDGTFKPDRKITRAEFASIVSRYLNLTETELISFPDLKSDHWAYDDIVKVATAGIMEGYEDGTFGPQKYVTRAEAATIINRMLKRVPDKDYIKSKNITGFSDIKNHWAYYQIVEATLKHNYIMENGVEKYQ